MRSGPGDSQRDGLRDGLKSGPEGNLRNGLRDGLRRGPEAGQRDGLKRGLQDEMQKKLRDPAWVLRQRRESERGSWRSKDVGD